MLQRQPSTTICFIHIDKNHHQVFALSLSLAFRLTYSVLSLKQKHIRTIVASQMHTLYHLFISLSLSHTHTHKHIFFLSLTESKNLLNSHSHHKRIFFSLSQIKLYVIWSMFFNDLWWKTLCYFVCLFYLFAHFLHNLRYEHKYLNSDKRHFKISYFCIGPRVTKFFWVLLLATTLAAEPDDNRKV